GLGMCWPCRARRGALRWSWPSTRRTVSAVGPPARLASVVWPIEGVPVATSRTYDVPAISCGHCKEAIEAAVAQLDGVDTVAVDIDAKTVTVAGDAPDEAVVAAIDDAGY